MGVFSLLSAFLRPATAPSGGWPTPVVPESRASEKFLVEMLTAGTAASGVQVSEETATRYLTVLACVKVLSESLAVPPLRMYRRFPDGSRERALDHPLYPILHDLPNTQFSSFEAREFLQGCLGLRGNAYAEVIRTGGGRVLALNPLLPSQVHTYRLESGRVAYDVRDITGTNPRTLLAGEGELLHIKGFSKDGMLGLSPIGEAREAVGLGIAAERFGAQFFANSARPSGVLTHPQRFAKAETAQRIKDEWQRIYSGEARHSVAVLEEGMKFESIGISNEDSQYLEIRKFQRTEICALYRIPPHLIADLERSTNNNIEHSSLEFLIYTMLAWFRRWEQAIHRDLLTERERKEYYVRFDADEFLRGDFESRQRGLAIQRQNGIINGDEWRAQENMNPIKDGKGEEYWRPANMGQGTAADPSQPLGGTKP